MWEDEGPHERGAEAEGAWQGAEGVDEFAVGDAPVCPVSGELGDGGGGAGRASGDGDPVGGADDCAEDEEDRVPNLRAVEAVLSEARGEVVGGVDGVA